MIDRSLNNKFIVNICCILLFLFLLQRIYHRVPFCFPHTTIWTAVATEISMGCIVWCNVTCCNNWQLYCFVDCVGWVLTFSFSMILWLFVYLSICPLNLKIILEMCLKYCIHYLLFPWLYRNTNWMLWNMSFILY